MARVNIDLPALFPFATRLAVRVTDINYGGHLGNDALLALVQEARAQFLASLGYSEMNVEGTGIIMTDAVIVYRAQVYYGDLLTIKVAVSDMQRTRCDLLYRVTKGVSEQEVARVKTGIAFFDYQNDRVVSMPDRFRTRVSMVPPEEGM